jgi:hypothetical protein
VRCITAPMCRCKLFARGLDPCLSLTLFLMNLARVPKRSVEMVSDMLYDDGEHATMSAVRAPPPSESCSHPSPTAPQAQLLRSSN